MSLDVYLTLEDKNQKIEIGSGIFIRENGSTREIPREEWDKKFPGTEPVVFLKDESDYDYGEVFSANITHNLNTMADEAGIYYHLWRPDECNITKARELIDALTAGLWKLRSDSDYFEQFEPENGWGNYEGLVAFVEKYLNACKTYPEANVSVWR